jgi:hypothetical protein
MALPFLFLMRIPSGGVDLREKRDERVVITA